MKLNPDSVVLQQLDGHWQKLAMLILWKLAGRNTVKITQEDLARFSEEFQPGIPVMFTHGHADSLEFSIVTESAAERISAHDSKTRPTGTQ